MIANFEYELYHSALKTNACIAFNSCSMQRPCKAMKVMRTLLLTQDAGIVSSQSC